MKQVTGIFSKKQSIQQNSNKSQKSYKQTEHKVPNSNKKLAQQIQKLKKQIQMTNQDIKQTQKHLDVDLFLKQQKKKKMQHAKNITAQYEAQKKIREEKLYKKHNRDKLPSNHHNKNQKQDSNLLFFKTNNIAVFTPTAIIKSITNQVQNNKSQWIRNGHIFRDQECGDLQKLRLQQQKIFQKLYHNEATLKQKYDGDSEAKHIKWKKIQQVCENCLELQCFPNLPQEHQFLVGASENQQILNAMTLMTKQIASVLFAQTQNTFAAKFNTSSKQVTVVTDKMVLARQFKHKNINLGARCHNSNIIWPTLIEKCAMKVQKFCGYEPGQSKLTLLQQIFMIYGLDAEIVPITNQNIIKQNFPLVLGHLLQEGKVGLMNIGRVKKTCYQGRIYILDSIKEQVIFTKKKNQYITQVNYMIKDPWRGKLLDSSNTNKFNILELLGHFNILVLLKQYPQKWMCLRINFSYYSCGSINLSNNEWTKNPQYLFTITKNMSLRIKLRKSGNNIQEKKGQAQNIFGFLLFQNKEAQNKIQCMKMDALITKTKSNDFNQACFSGQLAKGNYIVIPYSTYKSEKAYQFYTLDFIVQRQNWIQFGKARLHQWQYVAQKGARLAQGQKVIESIQSKQKFERPKIQKFELPKLFADKITKKIIDGLNLNYYKNCQSKHFFMPGFIKKLLINTSIDVQKNLVKNKNQNPIHKQTIGNEQITKEEQAQSMQILLGYDVLNDDINQGNMREYLQQSVGIYDFRGFGLKQDGLIPILECLGQHPQIIQLDLSENQLGDSSITFLCYYLEKANRIQLRQLKLFNNPIGFVGKCALQGLKKAFPKINIQCTGIKIQ